jgi:hypothetical protein
MTEAQKESKEQFKTICEDMPFAGMMEAMMSQKEELCGCGCIEIMKKMAPKSSWPQKKGKETSE